MIAINFLLQPNLGDVFNIKAALGALFEHFQHLTRSIIIISNTNYYKDCDFPACLTVSMSKFKA
jgi:hypothetical protein